MRLTVQRMTQVFYELKPFGGTRAVHQWRKLLSRQLADGHRAVLAVAVVEQGREHAAKRRVLWIGIGTEQMIDPLR